MARPRWASRRILREAAILCLAIVALPTARASGQRPPQRSVETAIDFSTGQGDNLFSVLRSQDHIHAFEEGLAEIAAGEHRAGVERLHRLLQMENGGVVPVAPGRFLGLRLAVITSMANLSPAAKAAYEELVQREGGAVDDLTALAPEALLLLAERFPAAQVGLRARLRLGDLALTGGDGALAASHFRSALDQSPIGSADEQRIATRLRCAGLLLDPAAAHADRQHQRLAATDDDVLGIVPFAATSRTWPSLGGGGSGRTPMAELTGQPDTRWTEEISAPGFDEREISQFPMYAVGDLDGLYVNTGQEVVALDPLRKGIAWVSQSPMREYGQNGLQRRPRGDDGVNEDMVLAAACSDDVVVAALQVPEKSMNVDFHGGYRVMSKIPMRRLYAFARQSGKVLWSHYDDLDGPRTRRYRGHDACANPLIVGDTVYVPIHDRSGAIAFSIGAYDLRTGQLRWRRLVCSSQQDVNMFGNARAEFAASPICLHDGVLYGASNLGVSFAIEAATGRLRWLSAYEVVRMPRTMIHQQQDRQVFFANNSPVVADGVVCLTPLDSQFVLGIDAESGRVLWRVAAQATVDNTDNRVVWLAGALHDEFVLAGSGAIAVKARPESTFGDRATVRQLVPPELLGDRRNSLLPPRPAVTDDAVWFARADTLLGFDRDGKPAAGSPLRLGRFLPGNLLLVGGIAVSLRQHVLEVAYDAQALRHHVEEAAKSRPDDPALLLRLASLRRALLPENADPRELALVQQTYQQGLDAAVRRGLPPGHPVRVALQRELFEQALRLAEAAVRGGAADALSLLARARDVAPSEDLWLQVQALVLARSSDDAASFASELDRLATKAPDGTFPHGDGVPVRTWVAWQRARLATTPADAVARWQELLEVHGEQVLDGTAAATLARQSIDALIQRHGEGCYADVRARAEAALAAAGEDRQALAAVSSRFPNSAAAEQARVRLLDAAVRAGDLAIVCGVLAQALANGQVPPGIARRAVFAAGQRGNQALAFALAQRLRQHGALVSDWPDDRGRSYAEILAALPPAMPSRPASDLLLPTFDVAAIRPRSASEFPLLVTLLPAAGFVPPADAPLYVKAERELLAIDIHAKVDPKPVLFAVPIDFLDHAVLCGTTLIVPDMDRVFALDYRTGEKRWELPNGKRRLLESLGVQQGVLHISALPRTADGDGEFLGIEPLTGVVLFAQTLAGDVLKPKAIDGALLRMEVLRDGGAAIQRLDPISGETASTTTIVGSVLQSHIQLEPDSLSTRFYPQSLCSDGAMLFLPVDSSLSGDAPRVVAVDGDGKVVWHWRGNAGGQLPIAALRGDRLVVLETSDRRSARLLLLRAKDGELLREVDVGHDAAVLNWERSWLANPAPGMLAVESFADADRTTRQLVCFAVDDQGPTFVLTLGKEDGEIVHAPQFGSDFVTFGTRPATGNDNCRLWLVSLQDRSGMLPDGRKHRLLPTPGGVDSMSRADGHVVVSGAQGILLLGPSQGTR